MTLNLPLPPGDPGRPGRTFAEPVTLSLEVEFTNACNAACTACPRAEMPESGFLQYATLRRILDLYDKALAPLPRATIAGGGEPLLNRRALDLIRLVVGRGFATTLITNASPLNSARIRALAESGLAQICVSFWGVRADEYEKAMKLPYTATLSKVERLRDALKGSTTELSIIWVRTPQTTSTDAEVRDFWHTRGISVDLEDTKAWNRGGLLTEGFGVFKGDAPDPGRRLWCADLHFADAFDWRGRLLLCCCNYFMRRQTELARVEDGRAAMRRAKRQISDARPLPEPCLICTLPRAARARFLLGDRLASLSHGERIELLDYPPAEAG